MNTLRTFMSRLESSHAPEQLRTREAERLEIDPAAWAALRAMNVDLALVRAAHRAVSKRGSVRRADREGAWELVSGQPGKLRSHAQSFRVSSHVEPAWDHTTLRHRVAELVNATRAAAAAAPGRVIARFLRTFAHAQPFLAHNERVALLVASVLLRSIGLPAFAASTAKTDPEYGPASSATDDAPMQRLVDRLLWTEALELAEWLPPVATGPRWTLAGEHAALAAARVPIDLGAIADEIMEVLSPLFEGSARRIAHNSFADRIRAATDAVHRGHPISPQHSIIETRWPMARERDAVLVIALAGRGIAGAASVHLSIEHRCVAAAGRAPGLLLPVDEPTDARRERLARWALAAMERATR